MLAASKIIPRDLAHHVFDRETRVVDLKYQDCLIKCFKPRYYRTRNKLYLETIPLITFIPLYDASEGNTVARVKVST